MAKIRHIAFYTDDPEKEADFYVSAFELKRVRTSPTGSVFLSDGYINLALLKAKGDGTKNGIHHLDSRWTASIQLPSACVAYARTLELSSPIQK